MPFYEEARKAEREMETCPVMNFCRDSERTQFLGMSTRNRKRILYCFTIIIIISTSSGQDTDEKEKGERDEFTGWVPKWINKPDYVISLHVQWYPRPPQCPPTPLMGVNEVIKCLQNVLFINTSQEMVINFNLFLIFSQSTAGEQDSFRPSSSNCTPLSAYLPPSPPPPMEKNFQSFTSLSWIQRTERIAQKFKQKPWWWLINLQSFFASTPPRNAVCITSPTTASQCKSINHPAHDYVVDSNHLRLIPGQTQADHQQRANGQGSRN